MVIHSVSICVFSTGAVGWGRAGRYKYIGERDCLAWTT